jgi:hypothetical protein
MGLSFTINHNLRRGQGACQGVISFHEVEQWMQQVVRSGAQAYTNLIDTRHGVLAIDRIGYKRFVRLVSEVAGQWNFGPIAFVVGDERTQAGVHTLGLLTQPTCPVRPFWDVEEAEKWLASAGRDSGV